MFEKSLETPDQELKNAVSERLIYLEQFMNTTLTNDEKKALEYKLKSLNNLEEHYKDVDCLEKASWLDEIANSYDIIGDREKDEKKREAWKKLAEQNRKNSLDMHQRLKKN